MTQGYVVVGTDYAGLGVHKDESGEPIVHESLAPPSHANDVVDAVQAAQNAFPELSQEFVVIGYSQGNGGTLGGQANLWILGWSCHLACDYNSRSARTSPLYKRGSSDPGDGFYFSGLQI